MKNITQVAQILGWMVVLLLVGHLLILAVMVLGIVYDPGSIQHTPYWDMLLRWLVPGV